MIRLFILMVGLFLVWLLFFSSFTRQRKIIISVLAVLICIVALWMEVSRGVSKSGIVAPSEVSSCGISAEHSYRSNYDLQLCFRNDSSVGEVKRLGFSVTVASCPVPNNCSELQTVERELAISIRPNAERVLEQNLSFEKIGSLPNTNIAWSVEVTSVEAIR